jgi:hypothetical protein
MADIDNYRCLTSCLMQKRSRPDIERLTRAFRKFNGTELLLRMSRKYRLGIYRRRHR